MYLRFGERPHEPKGREADPLDAELRELSQCCGAGLRAVALRPGVLVTVRNGDPTLDSSG